MSKRINPRFAALGLAGVLLLGGCPSPRLCNDVNIMYVDPAVNDDKFTQSVQEMIESARKSGKKVYIMGHGGTIKPLRREETKDGKYLIFEHKGEIYRYRLGD